MLLTDTRYVSTVWQWAPFPTKDVALKKVVFDDEELLALYEGLPLSPEIDPSLATQEWLRQGSLTPISTREGKL